MGSRRRSPPVAAMLAGPIFLAASICGVTAYYEKLAGVESRPSGGSSFTVSRRVSNLFISHKKSTISPRAIAQSIDKIRESRDELLELAVHIVRTSDQSHGILIDDLITAVELKVDQYSNGTSGIGDPILARLFLTNLRRKWPPTDHQNSEYSLRGESALIAFRDEIQIIAVSSADVLITALPRGQRDIQDDGVAGRIRALEVNSPIAYHVLTSLLTEDQRNAF